MKFVFVVLLLVAVIGPESYVQTITAGAQMKELVEKLNGIQLLLGGSDSNLDKIVKQILATLTLHKSNAHANFIAGDDGLIYNGGLVGELVGALLGLVSVILGGDNGLCGGSHGLVMQQHQGILGEVLDLVGPFLGPLGNGGGPGFI